MIDQLNLERIQQESDKILDKMKPYLHELAKPVRDDDTIEWSAFMSIIFTVLVNMIATELIIFMNIDPTLDQDMLIKGFSESLTVAINASMQRNNKFISETPSTIQ